MRQLSTTDPDNFNIRTAVCVLTYTADADREIWFRIFATVVGNGDYTAYLTIQRLGAGAEFRVSPVSVAAVASGVTSMALQSQTICVKDTDVVKVYLVGLVDDSATSAVIREVWDSCIPAVAAGEAGGLYKNPTAQPSQYLWIGDNATPGPATNDYGTLACYLNGDGTAATQLPTVGSALLVDSTTPGYLYGPERGYLTDGVAAIFDNATAYGGTIGDDIVFRNGSYNRGTAGDYIVFSNNSINDTAGIVGSYCRFESGSFNLGTVANEADLVTAASQGGTFAGNVCLHRKCDVSVATITGTVYYLYDDQLSGTAISGTPAAGSPNALLQQIDTGVVVDAPATVGAYPAATLVNAPAVPILPFQSRVSDSGKLDWISIDAYQYARIKAMITVLDADDVAVTLTGKVVDVCLFDQTTGVTAFAFSSAGTSPEVTIGGTYGNALTIDGSETHAATAATYGLVVRNTTDKIAVGFGVLKVHRAGNVIAP